MDILQGPDGWITHELNGGKSDAKCTSIVARATSDIIEHIVRGVRPADLRAPSDDRPPRTRSRK